MDTSFTKRPKQTSPTFDSKLQSLLECHRNLALGTLTGVLSTDLINQLRGFSQLLLKIFRDCQAIQMGSDDAVLVYRPLKPPMFGYVELYDALISTIDFVPALQSTPGVSVEILRCLGCLIPFLNTETLRNYFTDFNRLISVSHESIYKDLMEVFCDSIVAQLFDICKLYNEEYIVRSFPATMATVFEYIPECNLQSSFCEALLGSRRNMINDMLQVIAYGSFNCKIAVTAMLFKYWPMINILDIDKRTTALNLQPRNPTYCQSAKCNDQFSIASWVCIDVSVCQSFVQTTPPPFYLCNGCYADLNDVQKQHSKIIVYPVLQISLKCQYLRCHSICNDCFVICYCHECCALNDNRPLSLCKECHQILHLNEENSSNVNSHIYQSTLATFDNLDRNLQTQLIRSIMSLLKEALDPRDRSCITNLVTILQSEGSRKILSHYAISLLIYAVPPNASIHPDILAELLYTIFKWFTSTVCLPDDVLSSLMEKLKIQSLIPWVKEAIAGNRELLMSILLPQSSTSFDNLHTWEEATNQTIEIRNGLNLLYSLVTYDLISLEIWNFVISYWLEVVNTVLPESHLEEFQTLFNKLFDTEMSPMLAHKEDLYGFMIERFESPAPALIQEQALQWMQLLCKLRVSIPIDMLLNMMLTGAQSLIKLESRASRREIFECSSDTSAEQTSKQAHSAVFDTYETYRAHRNQLMMQQLSGQEMVSIIKEEEEEFIVNENRLNAPCCLLMLDILLNQINIQRFPQKHQGMYNPISKRIINLINLQLTLPWVFRHICTSEEPDKQCEACELQLSWFNVSRLLLAYISPHDDVKLPDSELPTTTELKSKCFTEYKNKDMQPPSEVDENNKNRSLLDQIIENKPENGVWVTAAGIYHFKLSSLLPHLQLFYNMLKEVSQVWNVDALHHLMTILHMLVLKDEVLSTAVKTNAGFLSYCVEKMIVPLLWRIFSLGYCQLNRTCLTLLLHTIAHDQGASALRTIIERDFSSPDWEMRTTAVAAVFSIVELLSFKQIKSHYQALSITAFASMKTLEMLDDIEPAVCLKTSITMSSLSDKSIKAILGAFEFQFDYVIADRCLVLQNVYKLHTCLLKNKRKLLSWDFFMNRFDTLFLEDQIILQELGEILAPTSITGSNTDSEHFNRKLNLVRYALERADEISKITTIMNQQQKLKVCLTDNVTNETSVETSTSLLSRERRVSSIGTFTEQDTGCHASVDNENIIEGRNEHVIYYLVNLLMNFMITDDQAVVTEDRIDYKHQLSKEDSRMADLFDETF